MYKVSGSCHCGNITLEIDFTNNPSSYKPRVCDCSFCRKHGASYISDKNGKISISVKSLSNLNKYKQGRCIAEFLLCNICGVLVVVCYEERGHIYSSINSKVINHDVELGEYQIVSPKQLSDSEKKIRWKSIWFSNVKIEYGDSKEPIGIGTYTK